MKVFSNKNRDFYICTNYKVMYSSLEFDKNTISISNKEFFFKNILKKTRIINTPFYLFFRNPLSRLESFYSNKLCLSDNPEKWEHCQLIFLNHFGIDIKSSSAQKVSFLSSITFEKFVDVLPKVFLKDLHLRPQHFSFVIKLRKLRLTNKVKYDAIINIENNDQILKLEQILDLKLLHKNQSDRNMITFDHSDSTIAKVKKLYHQDFTIFNKIKNHN